MYKLLICLLFLAGCSNNKCPETKVIVLNPEYVRTCFKNIDNSYDIIQITELSGDRYRYASHRCDYQDVYKCVWSLNGLITSEELDRYFNIIECPKEKLK